LRTGKFQSKNNTKTNFASEFEILSIINYHTQQYKNLRTGKFQSKNNTKINFTSEFEILSTINYHTQ